MTIAQKHIWILCCDKSLYYRKIVQIYSDFSSLLHICRALMLSLITTCHTKLGVRYLQE
jgi:hypothetical protein